MRAAARMIGQTLTMPIGIAHEGVHSFAAALCGLDTQIVVQPDGSQVFVDFDDASPGQRPLIALAPTIAAVFMLPVVFYLYLFVGPTVSAIAAVAVGLFGFPSAADRQVAFGPVRNDDRQQGVDH